MQPSLRRVTIRPTRGEGAHSADGRLGLFPTAIVSGLSALCFASSFHPLGFFWLMPVSLALFALAATEPRRRRMVVLVVGATWFVAWLWLHRWISEVSAVGHPALALYLTAWSVVAALLVRRLARRRPTSRWPFALLLPLCWGAIETLRGTILFDGYPWFLAAHPVVEAPLLAQSADLFGAAFVGALVCAAGGAIIDLFSRRVSASTRRRTLITVALLWSFNAAYGQWRLHQSTTATIPGPRVLAIQTNLSVSNKISWALEDQKRDLARFIEQTRAAFAGQRGEVDLIAWPETMLPGTGLEQETLEAIAQRRRWPGDWAARAILDLSEELATPMIIGSPAYVGVRANDRGVQEGAPMFTWARHHNSAYLIAPGRLDTAGAGTIDRYDKLFLTPFGETMPYISAWPWLEEQLLAIGASGMSFDLDEGDGSIMRLTVPRESSTSGAAAVSWAIATPICFEDTVSWLCRRMAFEGGAKRIDLFVNLSNDGWFGSTSGGREQHAQIARWRAIENRVPIVRVANTGISVAIDSSGRLRERIEPEGPRRYGRAHIEAALVAETRIDRRTTLHGRLGDAWAYGSLGLTLALILAGMSRRNVHGAHR